MVVEQIGLGLSIGSVILVLLNIIFLVKLREFERSDLENSLNAMVFGLFFLLIFMIISVLDFAYQAAPGSVEEVVADAGTYISYLVQIADLAIIPLFAVCFFVGVYVARDNLMEE